MKKLPDKVNAAFEFCGGWFILLNVMKLLQDKSVAGVDWRAVAFFTLWGYWNCFYYRNLGQRASHYCGIFIGVMNTIWLSLLIYYSMF